MAFISYSQNLEDVVLWKVLHEVPRGFYVDVGAFDPEEDSTTKAFYDRGWTGLNIEPRPELLERFSTARPYDTNLAIAISETHAVSTLFVFEGTGLSTLSHEIANRHIARGFDVSIQEVKTYTLAQVLDKYLNDSQIIHFLKIDVEGLEKQVITGGNWTKYRPWVVVVESTLPTTTVDQSAQWETYLLANNYELVYRDGLNNFYLALEKSELKNRFQFPPNIFDNYKSSKFDSLEKTKEALESQLLKCEGAIEILEIEVEQLKKSLSWRITSPFRRLFGLILRSINLTRRIAGKLLHLSLTKVQKSPWASSLITFSSKSFPRLTYIVLSIASRAKNFDSGFETTKKQSVSLSELSNRGLEVFNFLRSKRDNE